MKIRRVICDEDNCRLDKSSMADQSGGSTTAGIGVDQAEYLLPLSDIKSRSHSTPSKKRKRRCLTGGSRRRVTGKKGRQTGRGKKSSKKRGNSKSVKRIKSQVGGRKRKKQKQRRS